MKSIFEAENAIEAHMISGLLEQKGILSNINGEYLQGGVGDIQPQGYIQITVNESDYASAREIIEDWESKQIPISTPDENSPNKPGLWSGILIGLIIGIGLTFWLISPPPYINGIDHNRDGINDEVWTYINNRISKSEADRNFDGEVDYIINFNYKGIISNSKIDNDFDGVFEGSNKFSKGSVYIEKYDSNDGGSVDLINYLQHGVLNKIEFYSEALKTPIKVQYFTRGKLIRSEFDTDKNGTLDVEYIYDEFEEISKKNTIQF
jgi:hypothetical protein